MADIGGAIGSAVGGLGSLFGGLATSHADEVQAQGYDTAATFAAQNAFLSGEAGGINELAAARQIQRAQGADIAGASGGGLKIGGSAAAIIRDATQQGSLQQGTIGLQTAINVTNFQEQEQALHGAAEAARAAASAAKSGGAFGAIGGVIGGLAKLFF